MSEMDPNAHIKSFTLEEANAQIPRLTELIDQMHGIRDRIAAQEVEIDALELISESKKEGHARQVDEHLDAYNLSIADFYNVIDEIHGLGCYLKDPNFGLVDFYSLRDGRVIYLCWRYGEDRIRFWHEVGRGYGDRQPLESA